ncbi:uncharacterized protein TNCV_383501 [Trichonephila clavipes]|nr:uncharacterized protein TNCV_383501 [Trichonephila clavipes]
MMKAGLLGRRVARQVGRSNLTVRRYWYQWTEQTSLTRRPVSGSPQKTSRREDHPIVRHARVEPIASLDAFQTQAAPSLRAPVSS